MWTFVCTILLGSSLSIISASPGVVKRADRACVVDGESFDSGATFTLESSGTSKCFVFICRDGSYTLQSGVDCDLDKKSTSSGNDIYINIDGKFLTGTGCEDKQGNCQDVGSKWVDNCTTYSCTVVDNMYGTNIDSIQCKDADGVCRAAGETFPYVVNGNRYPSCTCTVSGTMSSYSCSG